MQNKCMTTLKIVPLAHPVTKEVLLPGSLSYTIRALTIASLTKGPVKIVSPLKSDDVTSMVNILENLGIQIDEDEDSYTVVGDVSDCKDKHYDLTVGVSGRTARTALALLCIAPGTKKLDCDDSFKKRPIKDLVDGLRQMGAAIDYLENEGCLPVHISSSELNPGEVSVEGSISSQYISALMMIAPIIGDITIVVPGAQSSKPFIDITKDIMQSFGVIVANDRYKRYGIRGGQSYQNPEEYIVEPDAISASYFFAIAALSRSKITVPNLSPDSCQGDIKFVDVLERMGCRVEKNQKERWIAVEGTQSLRGVEVDMNDMPDTVQTLAVVAAFAKGTTHITGLSHLKVKETDRITAPAAELKKMGVTVRPTENSITIEGGSPHGAIIETYGDHRMAMAFAVAGATIEDMIIHDSDVVNKSFPAFWTTLSTLGVKTKNVTR